MKKPLQPHIVIVGAGPGGLTAAILLAARGFKVTVVEKEARVGGRNAAILSNGYKFDTGPTFLMMKFILDEVFEEAGRHIADYVLVPVPNRTAKIDWAKEKTAFRDRVIATMETRGGMTNLGRHIREEIVFTPQTWQYMNTDNQGLPNESK